MSAAAISGLVVPRAGQSVWLVVFSAAAMGFLAVFVLALATSSAQLARGWEAQLAQTATVRVSAPPEEMEMQTALVMEVLRTTPGIAEARVMEPQEQAALLEVWLGPDLPLDALPMPRLIELRETPQGPDRQGLRLRLSAEAPGAVYDDHTRWRRPLVQAAARLKGVAWGALVLIGGVTCAIIALAASASLASNGQVIKVLRLVGARDRFIASAFVQRISRLALFGAALGTAIAMAALWALPELGGDALGGTAQHMAGIGFQGAGWLLPLLVPPVAMGLAFLASLATAFHVLRGVT
ncbi:MAG: cell division protein FtsX [Roseinatronobacter sp.]|nr:cell division protein FtsX [Roseinatronobacter sp.]